MPACFVHSRESPYNATAQPGGESFARWRARAILFPVSISLFTGAKAVAPEIDHLQRALKAKTGEVADKTLLRHLTLFKESQLKVELEKLKRKGKFEEADEKADELERQIGLLASYDFSLKALTNEAFDLHLQITELEAEELKIQLQRLRSELRQTMEGAESNKENTKALTRQIDAVTSAWLEKTTEVIQLQDETSERSRAWREKFMGVQLK